MKRRILYIQFTNPAGYPPLQHSARILADSGWHVLFLGIGYPDTERLRIPTHPNIEVKLHRPGPGARRRVLPFLYYMLWVWWWSVRWRPVWVYASDVLATPAAWVCTYLPFLRVVYHEHDTPNPSRGLARWCMKTRERLAARAALCVLPNAERAKRFSREFGVGAKTFVVWNCPARTEVAPYAPHNSQSPAAPFRLLYHGSVVPSRLPASVIEALALLPARVSLRVIGYETVGHAGYVEALLERARGLNVAQRVEWKGAVPTRAELLEHVNECSVGLALMPMRGGDESEETMAGASNKPFDYMACGLGLVVSDLADWRAIFVGSGLARVCNSEDAASIAAAVCWYLDHPEERIKQSENARLKIANEWNYETQFAPVMQEMQKGLS